MLMWSFGLLMMQDLVATGFPEFVAAGRPYYDLPLYTGQLDEVWPPEIAELRPDEP